MKLSVCIFEDDKVHMDILRRMIEEWSDLRHAEIAFFCFANSMDMEPTRITGFDVVFIDVMLGNELGFELAKELRCADPLLPIVFVSSYAQYSLDCHGLMAIDFLTKPLERARCFCVLDKAVQITALRVKERVIIGKSNFLLNEIMYCEAKKHQTKVQTIFKSYIVAKGILGVAEALPPGYFSLIHRSFIVHWRYVQHIDRQHAVLLNGIALPLSRERAAECSEEYFNYLRKESR